MTVLHPKVSIIIPVYNCEDYLQRCLDSVYAQTYQDFEIIAIDDGSTDSSLEILKHNENSESRLTVISQDNHGQGYSRNRMLEQAKGEFVLFVDSDDFIEPLTLELTLARAEKDNSDIVHFDWKLSSLSPDRPATYLYINSEPFAHKYMLTGAECDEFLGANTFYSVANLYRKSFLDEHNIRYDEGHIYEDVIFMAKVANRAEKISIINSPLYIVQRNPNSTTRSNITTDKHYRDYIRAVRKSLGAIEPRTPHSTFHLTRYLLASFVAYYRKRIPRRYRADFAKEFVDIIHSITLEPIDSGERGRLLRKMIQLDIFEKKRYAIFRALVLYKIVLMPRKDKLKSILKRLKHRLLNRDSQDYKNHLKKPINQGSIAFLGFDFRYEGNSRYLFEDIVNDERFKDREVKFITEDPSAEDRYRLAPDTVESRRYLAQAELIIAESWVPGRIKKRFEDAFWIQLWHGTPLKRVLFDSHEPSIMSKYDKHKVHKYQDTLRWDYLLADSSSAAEKFQSAFLYPKERIIQAGYPRVKYLLGSLDNQTKKENIKKTAGLDGSLADKKVVLYVPTWRDYNYHKSSQELNYDYVLDINKLAASLGDEYVVLFHDHGYTSSNVGDLDDRCIDVSGQDVQDLLLISDHVVSDYSSIIFDAFACDIPVSLYVTDFEEYEASRGVYGDIWADLDGYKATSVEALADLINNYPLTEAYYEFKDKYCYNPKTDLVQFISELDPSRIERDW